MHDVEKFQDAIKRIIEVDPRYSPDAYDFIGKAVTYTAKRLKRHKKNGNPHVSGKELLEGVCHYATTQFGPMANAVMREWGLTSGRAVGDVVFNMINERLLRKSENDTLDDFDIDFDFEAELAKPFQPRRKPTKTPIIQ